MTALYICFVSWATYTMKSYSLSGVNNGYGRGLPTLNFRSWVYILYLIIHSKIILSHSHQCSARGSVIHSLVTCVQTSTVLWIKTFKIQILWKTKQQLIEWSYFHDVTVSTYFWQGSDIAVWTIQPSFDADDNDVALPGLGLATEFLRYIPPFLWTFLQGASIMRTCRLFVTDASVFVTWVCTIP